VDLSDGLVSVLSGYVDFVKAEALAGNSPEPIGYSLAERDGW
jgi:hypothetical protein